MVSFGSKTKTIVSGSDNAFIFNGIKLLQTALNQIKTNKCVTSKENSLDTAIGLIDLILKGGYNVMNNATFPGLESFLTVNSNNSL